ncbi:uncharacterized protein LOC125675696 [Ostrea edulis]|uniref:uncharacterized protein LOC125675696 n=1 Tax=Ostrea edulis TaxID=37623 RepID=UPI00209541EC|nr:uncharacterized protein LOC125675696 [Ostrea edulis]
MKTLILFILFGVACSGSKFLPPGKKCQKLTLSELYDDNIWDTCEENQVPHCVLDDQCRHVRVCLKAVTISKGRCPVYNARENKMETRECTGEKCPDVNFSSQAVVKFDGCFQEINCSKRDEL